MRIWRLPSDKEPVFVDTVDSTEDSTMTLMPEVESTSSTVSMVSTINNRSSGERNVIQGGQEYKRQALPQSTRARNTTLPGNTLSRALDTVDRPPPAHLDRAAILANPYSPAVWWLPPLPGALRRTFVDLDAALAYCHEMRAAGYCTNWRRADGVWSVEAAGEDLVRMMRERRHGPR